MIKITRNTLKILLIFSTAAVISDSYAFSMTSSYSSMTLSQLRLALWYEGHGHIALPAKKALSSELDVKQKKKSSSPMPEELERALEKALEIVS